MYGGDRGKICVFMKALWLIVVDDSFKASRFSTRKEFIWAGVTLGVPCFLIKFILELPYMFLKFMFGLLLIG